MRYELYADSLFLVNFVMNLYLLLLVDKSTLRTATRGRLLGAAAAGGVSGLLSLLLPLPAFWKAAAGALGGAGMLLVAFPVRDLKMFLKLSETMLFYAFCLGGGLLFLIRTFPDLRGILTGRFGVMGAGGLCFLGLVLAGGRSGQGRGICRAVLQNGERKLKVAALLDSGNSLTEPISGQPVCILEQEAIAALFPEEPDGFRAVPYHSIGRQYGILKAYLLPRMEVRMDGVTKRFCRVYVAAAPEGIHAGSDQEAASIKMIINPLLFSQKRDGEPQRRQNERIYGFESGSAGKNENQDDTQGEAVLSQDRGNPLHRRSGSAAAAVGAGAGEPGHKRPGDGDRRGGKSHPH